MFAGEAGVRQLVAAFDSATVPASEWTHQAHLVVATWHVYHLGAAAALNVMRTGIIRLNGAHGTPNSDTRGYHETITCAYITLIDDVLAASRARSVLEAIEAVLSSPLEAPGVLSAYYSRERLLSVEARRAWVPPDLRPLPGAP